VRRGNFTDSRQFFGLLNSGKILYNEAMSELSFKVYCIENYAEYKNKSSSEVFEQFLKSKLLDHIKTDYEDLHGMGKEYLMNYFDRWLGEDSK